MSRGRCSPTEALALLSPVFAPMAAADELTRAIHSDRCHPYCRGVVIRSDIAPRLIVVAQVENDGRWTARIESTSYAPGGVQPAGVWEFEIDEVIELRQRAEAAQAAAAAAEEARAEAEQARAELEQARAALHAATERMEKAEARAAEVRAETATDNPSRRRPGPKPDYPLWRLEAATFANRFFKKKKRGPSAGEVAEHLQIKCKGWEPHPTDIRDLLKFLRLE